MMVEADQDLIHQVVYNLLNQILIGFDHNLSGVLQSANLQMFGINGLLKGEDVYKRQEYCGAAEIIPGKGRIYGSACGRRRAGNRAF